MIDPPAPRVPNPWVPRAARLVEVTSEIDGVATYRFQAAGNDSAQQYSFVPGQFNMLYLPGVGEAAISMSGDPEQPRDWIHTIRVVGQVTHTIEALQPGSTVGVRGPFGTGWPMQELTGNDVVLIAGGLGLAPLRPLIAHIVRNRPQFGKVCLMIGARTPATLLYRADYEHWRNADLDVQLTVDRADHSWTGHLGVVTVPLERMVLPRLEQTRVLTCGPEVMMKHVALSAIRRGIAADHVWVSIERHMQCAVGLCGHCQWGAELVCKTGPVLRFDRIQGYFSVDSL